MSRLRLNNLRGTVSDNPLSSGATTMVVPSTFPVVASPWWVVLSIEPDTTNEEIVYVTAHASGATTATIARGKENSTAIQHLQGVVWSHGPTVGDFSGFTDFRVKSPAYGAVGGAKLVTDATIKVSAVNLVPFRPANIQSRWKRGSLKFELRQESRFGNGLAKGNRFGGVNLNFRRQQQVGILTAFRSNMSVNSLLVTSPSGGFSGALVGMVVLVTGAGNGATTLSTTIASVISSTQILLTAPAQTDVQNVTLAFGYDDSAAFIAASNDAGTVGVGGSVYVDTDSFILMSSMPANGASWFIDNSNIYVGAAMANGLFQPRPLAQITGSAVFNGLGFPTNLVQGTTATTDMQINLQAQIYNLERRTHAFRFNGSSRVTLGGHMWTPDSLMVHAEGATTQVSTMIDIGGLRGGPMTRDCTGPYITSSSYDPDTARGHGWVEVGDFTGSQLMQEVNVHDSFFDGGGLSTGWAPFATICYGPNTNVRSANLDKLTAQHGAPWGFQDGVDHSNSSASNLTDCVVDDMFVGFDIVGSEITCHGLIARNNRGPGFQVGDPAVGGASSIIVFDACVGRYNATAIITPEAQRANFVVYQGGGSSRVDVVTWSNCIGYGLFGPANSKYGLGAFISDTTKVSNLVVTGGYMLGSVFLGIYDPSGVMVARGVQAYNPLFAVTTPTLSASTVDTINNTGVDGYVYIKGGTLTNISMGGQATGITVAATAGMAHIIFWPATAALNITYSVAPTIKLIGN